MKVAAYSLLALLCLALSGAACLAAVEVHGAFAVVAFALFVSAVASLLLAVDS